MKKQDITPEFLIDMWLQKYHNTTIAQVLKDHPEWEKEPEEHTRDFYKKYAVTKEQHDEWYKEAIVLLSKAYRMPQKRTKRMFAFGYLNTAPSIKEEI